MEERDDILDKCAEIVQSSSFSSTQKSKWEYDISQPWTGPLCGVILSLLPNLESLTLHVPGRGQVDDDREALSPLFGCTLKEDKNVGSRQSYHSYEQQVGISGRPNLNGLKDVAGLAKLQTLSLTPQAHITLSGLKHLPGIASLDITVVHGETPRYRHNSVTRVPYTEEECEEFRNIRSIRFAATMLSVGATSTVTFYRWLHS
jgi:hypothetical protein